MNNIVNTILVIEIFVNLTSTISIATLASDDIGKKVMGQIQRRSNKGYSYFCFQSRNHHNSYLFVSLWLFIVSVEMLSHSFGYVSITGERLQIFGLYLIYGLN